MSIRQLIVVFAVLLLGCSAGASYEPRDGDIVFHTSTSAQSVAIQKATHSPYSHMGIVFLKGGRAMVFEAVQPVRSTPLDEWVARGEDGHWVVKRLRDADAVLTGPAVERMREVGRAFSGKSYDLYFEWSDDRIYCSELVWKVYQRAVGIELGTLQRLDSLDLSDPEVQAKIHERWHGPPPAEEMVISPAAIFASDRLVTVHQE